MRYIPVAMVSVIILLTASSASFNSPAPPHRVSPLSLAMQAEGERLQNAGELDAAIGYFETALVADPRNADALIGLGEVAMSQQMPGKAIGQFREALSLRPDDRLALAGQGAAYVARGAIDRARQNLTSLQTLCAEQPCDEVAHLSAAIRGGSNTVRARTALRVDQIMPQPVIEAAPVRN